jgi:hypothetical protein
VLAKILERHLGHRLVSEYRDGVRLICKDDGEVLQQYKREKSRSSCCVTCDFVFSLGKFSGSELYKGNG